MANWQIRSPWFRMDLVNSDAPIFQAMILTPQLARRAYTLVRMAYPSVSLKTWMNHVRASASVRSRASGLIALVDARSYIHGLFAWRLLHHLEHRKALWISDVILAELPGHALQQAVFAAIRRISVAKEAGLVVIMAGKQAGGLRRDACIAHGFAPAGELLEAIPWTSREPAADGASNSRTGRGRFYEPAK